MFSVNARSPGQLSWKQGGRPSRERQPPCFLDSRPDQNDPLPYETHLMGLPHCSFLGGVLLRQTQLFWISFFDELVCQGPVNDRRQTDKIG